MASTKDRSGLALAGLAAVTWSLAGVWVRLLPGVPVPTVVAGRLGLAFVLLAPVFWLRRRDLEAGRPGWALAVLMAAYYVCAVGSFRFAPVAEATLFVNSSPLFAVAWAWVRREPLGRNELVGTALAFAGVAVIVLPGLVSGAGGRGRLVGDGLALLAAAGMAAYSVAFERLGDRAPTPLSVTAQTFALGVAASAGLLVLEGERALSGLEGAVPWGAFAGLAVVTTAVPTLAYSAASRRLPAVVTTTTRLLTPAFAAVAAWAVLGEVPSVWLAPGGALVIGGLLVSLVGERGDR